MTVSFGVPVALDLALDPKGEVRAEGDGAPGALSLHFIGAVRVPLPLLSPPTGAQADFLQRSRVSRWALTSHPLCSRGAPRAASAKPGPAHADSVKLALGVFTADTVPHTCGPSSLAAP